MLLNTKSFLVATKPLVFWCSFLPEKFKQPAPSNVFLNDVRVQLSQQVNDEDDIKRKVV